MVVYKHSSGSEAVDWILQNVSVDSRKAAVEVCQKCMVQKLIAHVADRTEFLDGYYYYRFTVRILISVIYTY